MTMFTFNATIPAAANNPSADQPIMLANNVSDLGIWEVNHVGYNAANGGIHTQIQMPTFITSPTVINKTISDGSIIYPAVGVADNTRAQLYFENAYAVPIPLSPIKAFGYFSGTGVTLNAMNLSVTTVHGNGLYTLTITSNVVTGNNYAISVTKSGNGAGPLATYTISGNTFNLQFSQSVNPDSFTVIILQI